MGVSALSRRPNRWCSRRNGAGAHQFASPSKRHGRWHQQAADERRVDNQSERQRHTHLLDAEHLSGAEADENNNNDQLGRGDDAAAALQSQLDRPVIGDPGVVQLLDPGDDEDLVVHRQPESEGEGEHRHPRPNPPAGS